MLLRFNVKFDFSFSLVVLFDNDENNEFRKANQKVNGYSDIELGFRALERAVNTM